MSGPFELAKLSAQVSVLMADKKNCPRPEMHKIAASYQSKGTLKTMANIVKHRGYTGLWTGLPFHLSGLSPCCPGSRCKLTDAVRDTLGTATYFVTYESSKQLLTKFGGEGAHSNPFAVLVAGGLCGVVSWALICKPQHLCPLQAADTSPADPVDSAKSIYQRNSLMYTKGEKVPRVVIEPFRRNMYRGLGVSVARSCAVNAVFFSSFEFLKKRIKAMDDE